MLEFVAGVWTCWLWLHAHFREHSDWGAPLALQPSLMEWYITVEELESDEAWRIRRYLPLLDREFRRLVRERRERETPATSNK